MELYLPSTPHKLCYSSFVTNLFIGKTGDKGVSEESTPLPLPGILACSFHLFAIGQFLLSLIWATKALLNKRLLNSRRALLSFITVFSLRTLFSGSTGSSGGFVCARELEGQSQNESDGTGEAGSVKEGRGVVPPKERLHSPHELIITTRCFCR